MNFDQIINFLLNVLSFFKRENKSEIQISKKFIENRDSSILKVIIPPRGDKDLFVTKVLMRRLKKRGYSTLAYFFGGVLISSDINQTIKSFNFIKNQIIPDISEFKNRYNFKRIDIIAPSLGVVNACLITDGNSDINNIFLLVPGSCLASSLWEGIRTKNLKEGYRGQNINKKQLQDAWKILAPKNNVNTLNDKNIFIAISKSDKIVPYNLGKELATLVQNRYPDNTIIKENAYWGHYLTVAKYYLFSKELLI